MNIQNPAAIFQLMNLWGRFQKNHPKFPKINAEDMEMIEQIKNMSFDR